MRRPMVMMRPEPGETKEEFKRRFAEALRAAAAETPERLNPTGATPGREATESVGQDDPDRR